MSHISRAPFLSLKRNISTSSIDDIVPLTVTGNSSMFASSFVVLGSCSLISGRSPTMKFCGLETPCGVIRRIWWLPRGASGAISKERTNRGLLGMFAEIPVPVTRTVATGDFCLISALTPSLLNHIVALSLMFFPSNITSMVCPRCAARGVIPVNCGAT